MNSRKSDKWHELRREGMSSADEDLRDYSMKTNHNKLGKKRNGAIHSSAAIHTTAGTA